jgi:hypothetical protein
MTDEEAHTANSTFAIGGVSCSADSFVVAESAALRMNICAKKPAHRKAQNVMGYASEQRFSAKISLEMSLQFHYLS